MKVLLDTCVLYPTVMREMLIGAARAGLFEPLWSERILGEWARAARKLGPEGVAVAEGEIARLKAEFPGAIVSPGQGLTARLYLPDPNDIHVLAAAIAGHADLLLTLNNADFPRHILAEEGIARDGPDGFLLSLMRAQPQTMIPVAQAVQREAERLSGAPWPLRKLLKKARLPRLGKALEAAGSTP